MLSLLGVIIGVFSLLVVLSVMEGFEQKMIHDVVGTKSEIKIHKSEYAPILDYNDQMQKLKNEFPKCNFAPVSSGELMLKNNSHLFVSNVIGVDYESYLQVSSVFDDMIIGQPSNADLENGIILGLELSLDLHATVGEYVQVTFPLGTIPTPFGLMPKTKRLRVVGIYSSNIPEYSSFTSFISIKNSQYFFQTGRGIQRIDVKTENPLMAEEQAVLIQQYLGEDFEVVSWKVFEKNLFMAINIEQKIVSFALFLMILISAMNLMGNMIKLITEKRKELGILKAMGASNKFISRIFVTIGLIIGMIGSLLGGGLAFLLLVTQQKYNFITLPIEAMNVEVLPIKIEYSNFVITIIISLTILIISSWIPAKKTLEIEPIKIIRNR